MEPAELLGYQHLGLGLAEVFQLLSQVGVHLLVLELEAVDLLCLVVAGLGDLVVDVGELLPKLQYFLFLQRKGWRFLENRFFVFGCEALFQALNSEGELLMGLEEGAGVIFCVGLSAGDFFILLAIPHPALFHLSDLVGQFLNFGTYLDLHFLLNQDLGILLPLGEVSNLDL